MDDLQPASSSRAVFSPENRLESFLLEAAREARLTSSLRHALRASTLYALGKTVGVARTEGVSDGSTRVQLFGVLVEGRRMIPVFTAESRIPVFLETSQPYVALVGRDLMRLVEEGVGIVINPASPCGMEMTYKEVQSIVQGDS